jgi:predicted transcriptional regulator
VAAGSLTLNAQRLLQLVRRRPGIHIREAQRRAGLGLGDTVYQLGKLSSLGLIDSTKNGKYRRYYPIDIDPSDRKVFSAFLVPSQRRILLFLLANQGSNLSKLTLGLKLSKSTVNWHLRILQSDGIVIATNSEAEPAEYQVADPKRVTELILRSRLSTIDKLSQRYLESWSLLDRTLS